MIQLISSFLFVIAFSFLSHAQAATPGNTELAPSGGAYVDGMCAACDHQTSEGSTLDNPQTDVERAITLGLGSEEYQRSQKANGNGNKATN